jgi:hypothetical protein
MVWFTTDLLVGTSHRRRLISVFAFIKNPVGAVDCAATEVTGQPLEKTT